MLAGVWLGRVICVGPLVLTLFFGGLFPGPCGARLPKVAARWAFNIFSEGTYFTITRGRFGCRGEVIVSGRWPSIDILYWGTDTSRCRLLTGGALPLGGSNGGAVLCAAGIAGVGRGFFDEHAHEAGCGNVRIA